MKNPLENHNIHAGPGEEFDLSREGRQPRITVKFYLPHRSGISMPICVENGTVASKSKRQYYGGP